VHRGVRALGARQLALTAYQVTERFYRQSVLAEAEQRLTAESLLRAFRGYGLLERRSRLGASCKRRG
jgi:hypothetical protein